VIVRCCVCGKPSDDALAITIDFGTGTGTGTGPLCWRCVEKGDEIWSPDDDEIVVESNDGYEVTVDREREPAFNGAWR
jgi:hypothetical protein